MTHPHGGAGNYTLLHKPGRNAGPAGGSNPPGSPSAWYDATKITGVSDGGNMATWSDSSGNDWTMTASANDPVYRKTGVNLINGLPVVQFSTAISYTGLVSALSLAQPFAGGLVFRGSSQTSACLIDSNTNEYCIIGTDGGDWAYYPGGGWSTDGAADSSVHMFTFVINGSSSLLRKDGASAITGGSGTTTMAAVSLGFQIGGVNGLSGVMGEVVLYSGTATTAFLESLESYFAAKWGT